ncbi:Gfo/Idh/MocA family protein [Lonepinella sp. BR2474]|uniref:Gfo/Idh/MocA family protein n=1 Tax=Lonepinella sp. BR2474 TaxID=3434548 RepID=UPI003F6E0622
MNPINVAIAGSGYSARLFHVPFFNTDPRYCIRKVYERTTDRVKGWLPDVEIVRNYTALLTDDIDLVVITTPNQTHYDMVKQAILAHKHVLVEKPLVATSQQAMELKALAEQQGVTLYVYQNRRWDSHIATAREILHKDLLGEPVDCEIRMERYAKSKNPKQWKETGEQGTGLMYDLGVHLIDQAVYLFGKPQAVFADIRSQHEDSIVDDNFDVHLYYANGLKVSLMASKYVREPNAQFALHGKRGSYVKAKADSQERLLIDGVAPVGQWNAEKETDWGILHTELNNDLVRYAYPNANTSYRALFDNLYDHLVQKASPFVTLDEVILVLTIIEKAFESAKTAQKIAI